jgi:hypothetical protein
MEGVFSSIVAINHASSLSARQPSHLTNKFLITSRFSALGLASASSVYESARISNRIDTR